jgi:hypothetical protein
LMLWVDAICIDQTDASEKSYQVGLMARIYMQAHQVIVWLGDGDRESYFTLESSEIYRLSA